MRGLILVLVTLTSVFTNNAQTIRSYMENEIICQSVQGPISEAPQHSGTWVEWSSSGDTITMMDGSLWKLNKSIDGLIHYRYTGTSRQPQPYTQQFEAIFNKDFSQMKICYAFGPIGMTVNMVGIYSYLGDGKQLAEDWINMSDEE